jgi:hypothetical protein
MAGTIIADTIQATSQQISLNVGNTTILTASSTGLTLIPTTNVNINVTNSTVAFGSGNVTRPSISFSGNTSSGMYMPLANTVAWSIAGSERLRLTSGGYLAVGTDAVNTTGQVRQLTLSNNGTPEFVLRDTSQAADSRNWRMFNASNSLYLGTLNDAGTSGTDVMKLTSGANLQFNSGYGSVATAYGCRAWCHYNGSQAIVGSGNVSSITVLATGDVRINFTVNMPDNSYAVVATTNEESGTPRLMNATQNATDNIRLVTWNLSSAKVNNSYNYVAVFR